MKLTINVLILAVASTLVFALQNFSSACRPAPIVCQPHLSLGAVSGRMNQLRRTGKTEKQTSWHYRSPWPYVSSLCMSSDMNYVASGRCDGLVMVWKLKPNKFVGSYDAFADVSPWVMQVNSLYVSSEDHILKVACDEGSTVAYSLSNGEMISCRRSGLHVSAPFVQILQNGQQVGIGSVRGTVAIKRFSRGNETETLRLPTSTLCRASISSSGQLIAISDSQGKVVLIDTRKMKRIASTQAQLNSSPGSDFSLDDSTFICHSTRANVEYVFIWSRRHPHTFRKIRLPGFGVDAQVALSPNGKLLAISDQAAFAEILNVKSSDHNKQILYVFGRQTNQILLGSASKYSTTCLAFSPNSLALLLGRGDGSARIYYLNTGERLDLDAGPNYRLVRRPT